MLRRTLAVVITVVVLGLLVVPAALAQVTGYETPTPFPTDDVTDYPSPPPSESEPPPTVPPGPPSDPPVPPEDPPLDPPNPPPLAATGIQAASAAGVAAVLIVGGASAVGVARRRRQQ